MVIALLPQQAGGLESGFLNHWGHLRLSIEQYYPKHLVSHSDAERWAGAVDTVGSTTLASVLAQMMYGSSVVTCGLAGGADLQTTVIPFLLRGINLLGIDSVVQPFDNRLTTWQRIAEDLPLEKLDALTETVGISAVPDAASAIIKGEIRGRLVVDVNV